MKQFKRVSVLALFALIGFALFHYATESKTGSAAWTTEVATHHFKDILEAQQAAIEAHTPLETLSERNCHTKMTSSVFSSVNEIGSSNSTIRFRMYKWMKRAVSYTQTRM